MAIVATRVREDFPILQRKVHQKPLVYLDNSATTQKPLCVIEAVQSFYSEINANVHRGVHTLSEEATRKYEQAHKDVMNFIGANSWREIVFTRNATEAINLVAYAWGLWNLQEGDEVIVSLMEHHSNIVPWLNLKRMKGIEVKFIDVTPDGRLNLEHFQTLLSPKTRLVGITHTSNVLGTINPVEEVVKMAKNVGALVLVDGAQSIPHLPVNVQSIGCDFLAGSGHKMLGPTGIGFLYARKELLQKMEPFLYGGDMIMEVTTEGATWNELPWKYEAGTPHIAGGIGLSAAIAYLQRLGMNEIVEYEHSLTEYTLQKLSEVPDIILYGPKSTENRLGVFSFNLKGIHPHDVAGLLDEDGIAIRSGHHCAQPLMRHLNILGACRASLYLYNTPEEIDHFITSLHGVLKIFS